MLLQQFARASTGLSTVSRNRIYNITSLGTGTGANAPVNIGIDNSSASLNIINNQFHFHHFYSRAEVNWYL